MSDHGVAIAALVNCDKLHEAHLLLMCECGWHQRLAEVATADHVAELVDEHRRNASALP